VYKLVFKGGGSGGPWWCQGTTTLENEHMWLVFKDGSGGGVAKEQPPLKTSICGSFSRVMVAVG